jgi:hypothetical protein
LHDERFTLSHLADRLDDGGGRRRRGHDLRGDARRGGAQRNLRIQTRRRALVSLSRTPRAPRRIPRPVPIDPKPRRDRDRGPSPRVAPPRRSLSTAAPRPPPPAPDARAPDAARRRIQRARVSSTHRSRAVVLVALARVPPSTPRPARADRDPIEGSRRAFIAPPDRVRPAPALSSARVRAIKILPIARARFEPSIDVARASARPRARRPPIASSRRGRARRPRRGRTFCSVSTRFALGAAAHRTVRWFFVARALEARAVTVGRAVAACIGASCAAQSASIGSGAAARARAIFLYDILPAFYSI